MGNWALGIGDFLNQVWLLVLGISPAMILAAVLAVFTGLWLYAIVRSIAALFSGENTDTPRRKPNLRGKRQKNHRVKTVLFTAALALLVIFAAAAPLWYMYENGILLPNAILIITAGVLTAGITGICILASLLVRSRDELAVLDDTVGSRTKWLEKAASELSIGREIQKKFLPLDTGRNGITLNYGCRETDNADFFGYYESAEETSGDYFDYHKLDDRYYAIIKCDIAGKGLPAALIMVQVATMFLNYFKGWKPSAQGMHIEELVYQINDFIEAMEFDGRFAAFTLCLFDSKTGELRFCNAGDNIIHIFDSSQKHFKAISLPQTPAAGALPDKMVRLKSGYHVQSLTLDPGDILLLYTDGIEESKRKFRDSKFAETTCSERLKNIPHGNHNPGDTVEELGQRRVREIINAVMHREIYKLYKWHSPDPEDSLVFDFSGCSGRMDELIMAIIAVEKIFRCYRDPRAGEDDMVLVDKKVNEFLKAHFLQYPAYCANTREHTGNSSYMYYTHLKEDEQYDDLTILGVKKK